MKHLIIILSLFGLLIQNLSKLVILTNFKLNRDFIAANLCEKKEESNNCCKGSCQLKKQLAEDDKKQQNPEQNLKNKYETQLFCNKLSFDFWNIFENKQYPIDKNISAPTSPSTSIFHPPKA